MDFSVDVCICTFRRPSLEQTLRSLAVQQFAEPSFRVVVADNDDGPSAEPLVHKVCTELGLPYLYVHAPERNISVARNACLNAASAPLVAFIDDDEEASPQWLSALVAGLEREALDVVFGPVQAIYENDCQPWLEAADLHSTRPALRSNGQIDTGYTCNVLMRRAVIGKLRFDVALGRSGGEDTVFFAHLNASGAKLGYVDAAWVSEPVPQNRASLKWLLTRSYRSGQSHARTLRAQNRRWKPAALAMTKAIYCGLTVVAKLPSAAAWRRAAVRGALHLGVVTRLLGGKEPELY